MEQFVNINDIGDVLIKYIGTEDFKRATDELSLESTNAFIGGIGMAGVLIMAKCEKYVASPTIMEVEAGKDEL